MPLSDADLTTAAEVGRGYLSIPIELRTCAAAQVMAATFIERQALPALADLRELRAAVLAYVEAKLTMSLDAFLRWLDTGPEADPLCAESYRAEARMIRLALGQDAPNGEEGTE